MQVNCTNPSIIINPLLPELVSKYGNIVFRGHKTTFINPKKQLYEFKFQDYAPSRCGITLDDFPNCYVCGDCPGETYPVYLQVPCGHCEVCKQSKVNSFVDRCKLETQMYKSNPLFLTLTYDEQHKKEFGVCLRDVQLFFKRLRINLYRKGYREKIRYVLVSEYGRRTHRPHYHAILWNCHATSFLDYKSIGATIKQSWSNGFVYCRLIDPSNDKAFYYTAKYLRKDCDVPDGCNKTFMVSSNRGGAIGAAFLDVLREHAARHLNTQLKYVNKWNGRAYEVKVSRYMLNRIVPSLAHSLPYSLKCRVRRFVYDYNVLYRRRSVCSYVFDEELDSFIQFFGKYFYIYNYNDDKPPFDNVRSDAAILREMLQDEIYIQRAMCKGSKFYDDAVYYDSRRLPYLTKLFAHQTDQDLVAKTYKIRRSRQLSAQLEVL